jgi:hypothetical protein
VIMKEGSEVIKLPGQHCSNYSHSSNIAIDIDIRSEESATSYSSHARIESHYSKTRPGGALVSSGIGIDVDLVDVDGELTATEDEAESLAESESDAGTQSMSRTLAPIQKYCTFHPILEPRRPFRTLDPKGTVSEEILLELDVGLVDRWRVLFDQFDPEGFGEIPWKDFELALESIEFRMQVGAGKLTLLKELTRLNCSRSSELLSGGGSAAITFQYFVNIVS